MQDKYRLPSSVVPTKYTISLKPDLKKFTFSGEETITINLKKPTKQIILHAIELAITSALIIIDKKEYLGKISYDEKSETATFTFPSVIPEGEGEILISFTGILNDKMRGFYRSSYEINREKLYMGVTQFESTDARRAFPCFDEPAMKAVFNVTLIVPKDTTAISNTIEKQTVETDGGYKKVTFTPTPKMSTYLLAFIVGKFEYVEKKTREGVKVRVFTTPGKKRQAEFALNTAVETLSFYNEYFDIDYPLPVLDLIAVPDFAAGAMENWGAVTFRETTLLIDPANSSLANKQWVALVIAHELAHMWFGDLVTMEWWTHLWLNEGFACFIEYLAVDALFPEWDIWTQFVATEHNIALSLDGLKNTHPIEVVVKNPAEISEIFDKVSYSKGASIIRMLALYLGQETFRDGLRFYLKKYAYKNTQTEDLWETLGKIAKKNVKKLMQNWTQKAGYPVLKVTKEKSFFQLSQQRFFKNSIVAQKTKDSTVWHIPLLVTGDSKRYMMDSKTFNLPKKTNTWVKLNSLESSFIRVAYPQDAFLAFSPAIKDKTFPAIDRLGIIRDSLNLSESGDLPTTSALLLLESYTKETDFTVWMEVSSSVYRLANLLYDDKKIYAKYREFALNIFQNIAKSAGWEKKQNEKHTEVLLRSLALYGYGTFGNLQTIAEAKERFTRMLATKRPLDPDIRGVVYNLVAENGGEKEFETFVSLYKKEELHQEKDRIARALTAFRRPSLLKKTLEWSLSKDVRSQDAPRVLYAVFANGEGRDIAWEFLKSHWEEYKKRYEGSHGFSRVLEGADAFTTLEKAREIEDFYKAHKSIQLERTVRQVIEQIQANAAWLQRDKAKVSSFL